MDVNLSNKPRPDLPLGYHGKAGLVARIEKKAKEYAWCVSLGQKMADRGGKFHGLGVREARIMGLGQHLWSL